MIVTEFYKERDDGTKLYKTYSDEKFKIKQKGTGKVYDEAIDIENTYHTYEETTEKIEVIEEQEVGDVTDRE